jgi:glycosyltransferase involved in cell wall biosynthesis
VRGERLNITFVSYVYPYPNRGYNPGVERVIGELTHFLAKRDHDVTVITTWKNGGQSKFEEDAGVKIRRVRTLNDYVGRVGTIFSSDLVSVNFSLKTYEDVLRNADVIHAFTPFLVDTHNVPLISHFLHDEEIRSATQFLHVPTNKLFWNLMYKRSEAVVSISDYSAQYLLKKGIAPGKIHVVPCGVDIDRFFPNKESNEVTRRFEGKNVLLFVGPLTKRKGLNYLIQSLPHVLEQHPNTILVIVGGGLAKPIQQLCIKLDVVDHVFFEGFVDEHKLPLYYNACDLFVFPSLLEGFGMVLTEAMACGKTVVASDTSSIPEVVGDAGLLVEPKNPQALANAIITLLDNTQLRETLEKKALKRIRDKFNWTAVATQMERIYKNLITDARTD